jgi:hypothetical protein
MGVVILRFSIGIFDDDGPEMCQRSVATAGGRLEGGDVQDCFASHHFDRLTRVGLGMSA